VSERSVSLQTQSVSRKPNSCGRSRVYNYSALARCSWFVGQSLRSALAGRGGRGDGATSTLGAVHIDSPRNVPRLAALVALLGRVVARREAVARQVVVPVAPAGVSALSIRARCPNPREWGPGTGPNAPLGRDSPKSQVCQGWAGGLIGRASGSVAVFRALVWPRRPSSLPAAACTSANQPERPCSHQIPTRARRRTRHPPHPRPAAPPSPRPPPLPPPPAPSGARPALTST
jgi:hypothetical protein